MYEIATIGDLASVGVAPCCGPCAQRMGETVAGVNVGTITPLKIAIGVAALVGGGLLLRRLLRKG